MKKFIPLIILLVLEAGLFFRPDFIYGIFIIYFIGLIYVLTFYQPKYAYIWLGLWSLPPLVAALWEAQITHIGLGLFFLICIIIILLCITEIFVKIVKYYPNIFRLFWFKK